MSKKQSYDNDIFRDVEIMSESELTSLYGIEFTNEGVFDAVENKTFNTLHEWASFYNDLIGNTSSYAKISKRGSIDEWDDEYY